MTYLQRPMFDAEDTGWRPTPVKDLPTWRNALRVAIDCETCDPDLKELGPGVRRGAFVAGVSFAVEGGPSHYLPIAHQGGDNLPRHHVLDYLRDEASRFSGEIVGMNLPYDLDFLAEQRVVFRNARRFLDVSVAAVLIDELHHDYSLDAILRRAGLEPKREGRLEQAARAWCLSKKAELWRLPARHVADYAIGDVELPLRLLRRQEKEIARQELDRVWDLECRVLPVTVKIRRRGVRIDLDRLEQIERWALGEENEFLRRVRAATGVLIPNYDILKKELTARALGAIGAKLPKTPTGQPKTDAATLEKIDHDVARWIVRAKKFHKMRCDFAGSIRRHLVSGRVHATFRQIKGTTEKEDEKGAAYGRFSSTDPNLQQQYSPEKEPEISAMWRKIFLPDEGALWAACDYSAQEPRMTVHYAREALCHGAEEMVEKYRANPRLDLHAETSALCRDPFVAIGLDTPKKRRKAAKTIFLGLCYGMGGAKLCRKLGLPTAQWTPRGSSHAIEVAGKEGRALLDAFHRLVPFVRDLAQKCQNRAQAVGYIRTIGGRRCRFPIDPAKSHGSRVVFDWTHKALNRLIQGSSADQGKEALVLADSCGFRVHVPVHDELDASVASRAEAEELGRLMERAVELAVPSVVDVEVGKSWGEVE